MSALIGILSHRIYSSCSGPRDGVDTRGPTKRIARRAQKRALFGVTRKQMCCRHLL